MYILVETGVQAAHDRHKKMFDLNGRIRTENEERDVSSQAISATSCHENFVIHDVTREDSDQTETQTRNQESRKKKTWQPRNAESSAGGEGFFPRSSRQTWGCRRLFFSFPLLEGDESGRVGRSKTCSTVGNGLVGDGELSEVVTGHLGLDLNGSERLSVVDTTDGTNHLRDDDHVSEVGLDGRGLLVGLSLSLGLSELLDETEGLSLESSGEPSAGSGVNELFGRVVKGRETKVIQNENVTKMRIRQKEIKKRKLSVSLSYTIFGRQKPEKKDLETHLNELLVREVQKLVQLNSSVRVLSELPLSLQLSGLGGIGELGVSLSG